MAPALTNLNNNAKTARSWLALGMNKSEAVKAIRPTVHNTGDFAIGHSVVGMKGGDQHGRINPAREARRQYFSDGALESHGPVSPSLFPA
jgi:hypothetical protein